MYIHTAMFKAHNENGFYSVTQDVTLAANLQIDPTKFSRSGSGGLRTWMRKGYCDRPSGVYAANFTLLMYKAAADYLMLMDSRGIHISFMNSEKLDLWNQKLPEIRALGLLLQATNSASQQFIVPTEVLDNAAIDQVRTDHGRLTCGEARIYMPWWSRKQMATAVVQAFGHPLENLKEALKMVYLPHSFKATVVQPKYDRNVGHRTVTTINF